jgi:6-phosphogluconolactonase
MEMRVFDDEQAVAEAAAHLIASEARAAISIRGRFLMALSGGRTPWMMLEKLASQQLPWNAVQVFQVDERVAPSGDADRNLTHLQSSLLARAPLPALHVHAMPVEAADLEAAGREYARELAAYAGSPPVLDLVHLGLGPDGHTASLVPGSRVLEEMHADVGLAGPYQGHRRMTLTLPIIDRAQRILWVVTGAEKAAMLRRLLDADATIPAGRVRQDRAIVLADLAAAKGIE